MHRQRNLILYITIWHIDAPLEAVCNAIYDLQSWPKWWSSVKRVHQVIAGNSDGVGGCYQFIWRGALPYRLHFEMDVIQFKPFHLIEGRVVGDVQGVGTWIFSVNGAITIARYEWQISISNPLVRFLAAIAHPLVRWNHNFVMQQGGFALATLLNARLLKIEHY